MPTYEYRCPEGHRFELFQRMSDEPRAACPTCGSEAVRLLSSGAGFLFKGEGFYITDYRSEDYRRAAKSEAKPAESGGSGSEAGAPESSPASKPAPQSAPPAAPRGAPQPAPAPATRPAASSRTRVVKPPTGSGGGSAS